MHIYSQTKFELSILYYFLTYEGVPKIQEKRHLAEKTFIYVKAPMHINSHPFFYFVKMAAE